MVEVEVVLDLLQILQDLLEDLVVEAHKVHLEALVIPLLFLLLKVITEDQVQAVDVQVLVVAELLQQVQALL